MTGILESVLNVFASVGGWIAEQMPVIMAMFYNAETGLTLLGVLAVAGLAFSVVFLLIGIIQRFLHFGG